MRLVYNVLLPLFIVFSFDSTAQALSGHGLVNPQSACNIRCENGGMCAFSFDDPHIHSCICLMGVYEGERCQYEVGVPRNIVQQTQQSQHVQAPPPPPTPVVTYQMKQMELERQREEERRRSYERRIDAERRRVEEGRRVGVMPVPARNPVEDQRIEEMRRRDEELRRIAARRREEERRRQLEERAREEQRSRQFGHEEEQRIREDEQRRRNEAEQRRKEAMKEQEEEEQMETSHGRDQIGSTTVGHDDEHLVTPPDGADWEYKSEEVDDTPPDDYLPDDPELEMKEVVSEKQETHDTTNDADREMHEETDTTTVHQHAFTEQVIEAEDDGTTTAEVLRGITKVIEAAADKTVKVHSLNLDSDSGAAGFEDDDYWDHSIKREDEDYDAPKVAESNEESQLTPAPSNAGGVREFTAEEGEEGWMMMKRVDENSSSTASLTLCLATVFLIVRLW